MEIFDILLLNESKKKKHRACVFFLSFHLLDKLRISIKMWRFNSYTSPNVIKSQFTVVNIVNLYSIYVFWYILIYLLIFTIFFIL